jgi:hypothetical protein
MVRVRREHARAVAREPHAGQLARKRADAAELAGIEVLDEDLLDRVEREVSPIRRDRAVHSSAGGLGELAEEDSTLVIPDREPVAIEPANRVTSVGREAPGPRAAKHLRDQLHRL